MYDDDMIYDMIWYDTFVNCNWVVTRWQQYSTHLHTNNTQNDTKQTIHRTTQNKQYTEQHNNLGECWPCPVLASYTLAFALQLREKHGKTSVRVAMMMMMMMTSYNKVRDSRVNASKLLQKFKIPVVPLHSSLYKHNLYGWPMLASHSC